MAAAVSASRLRAKSFQLPAQLQMLDWDGKSLLFTRALEKDRPFLPRRRDFAGAGAGGNVLCFVKGAWKCDLKTCFRRSSRTQLLLLPLVSGPPIHC